MRTKEEKEQLRQKAKENLKKDNVENSINKDDDDYYTVKRLKRYKKRY